MSIIVKRSDTMGFCMGVKRAMQIVEGIKIQEAKFPVVTLGPLIHNRLVLEKLKTSGIGRIENPDEIDKGTVIIRAHGIPPEIRDQIKAKGIDIVDATCPRVLHSQEIVKKYSDKGWHIILIGDSNHSEVKAIAGCAKNKDLIQTAEQAGNLKIPDKCLVIGQTTLRLDDYNYICGILKKKNPYIIIEDSICPAVNTRQEALVKLTAEVDAVLIIGGKDSANTKRLFQTARAEGKPGWHIEDVKEIPDEIKNFNKIGISAGASTPEWIIEEVEKAIAQG